jgi:hypothetical protein
MGGYRREFALLGLNQDTLNDILATFGCGFGLRDLLGC